MPEIYTERTGERGGWEIGERGRRQGAGHVAGASCSISLRDRRLGSRGHGTRPITRRIRTHKRALGNGAPSILNSEASASTMLHKIAIKINI